MVYVDNFNAPVGKMILCHLFTDNTEELLQMADKLGIDHKYMQWPGTPSECFEVTANRKRKAIAAGARKTTFTQYCKMSKISGKTRKGATRVNPHSVLVLITNKKQLNGRCKNETDH